MGAPERLPWQPDWLDGVGFAVWVCDPGGHIHCWNDHAEELFSKGEEMHFPPACAQIVGGVDPNGEKICGAQCQVRVDLARGVEIEPMVLRPKDDEEGPWLLVATIPLERPDLDERWLIHCAFDIDRAHRSEGYLARIASRSDQPAHLSHLTEREREILNLLSEDEDPHGIARQLHISYATVRNHVQHILEKLGVHSIQEAVARRLLGEEDAEPVP